MTISSTARTEAILLARWAIERHVKKIEIAPPDLTDPVFEELQGIFVTIHQGDQLRGCVGRVDPLMTLREEIPDLTLAAATRDPRFSPVSPQEADNIEIEISILEPPEKITDISDIQIGVHGIIIEKQEAKGLLLPQVAVQEGWDRESFLAQACIKAGQSEDAWKDPGTTLYRFSADVFSR